MGARAMLDAGVRKKAPKMDKGVELRYSKATNALQGSHVEDKSVEVTMGLAKLCSVLTFMHPMLHDVIITAFWGKPPALFTPGMVHAARCTASASCWRDMQDSTDKEPGSSCRPSDRSRPSVGLRRRMDRSSGRLRRWQVNFAIPQGAV